MADENKNKNLNPDPKVSEDEIKKLEEDLKAAFKEEKFDDVAKLAEELKKLDPENHLAERLLEKVKDAKAGKVKEANKEKIKILEIQAKQAFQAGNLPVVKKVAEELLKYDPENKTLAKIDKSIAKAKEALDKQVKKDKIKVLKQVIKELLKGEKWDDVTKKANELLAIDEKNSAAKSALKKVAKKKKVEYETLISPKQAEASKDEGEKDEVKLAVKAPEKAEEKHVLGADSEKGMAALPEKKGEKKPGFFAKLFKKKDKEEAKKDDKKLEVKKDEKPAMAVPAKSEKKEEFKTADKAPEKTEAKKEIAALPDKHAPDSDPVKGEKKPNIFTKLFKKKDEGKEEKKEDIKKEEAKPAMTAPAKIEKKEDIKPDLAKVSPGTEKPKMAVPKPLTKEDEIKNLENDLQQSLKEHKTADTNHLMEEIKKLDPKNKAVEKAQAQLDKDKLKMEEQMKSEKVKGMASELKEMVKNEDWDNAIKKSNELLAVDWDNSVAKGALKKAAKVQNVNDYKTLVTVKAPAKTEKKGFFAKLFKKEEVKAPLGKPAEALKPAEMAKPATPISAAPAQKPVGVQPAKPISPMTPKAEMKKEDAPKPEVAKPVITPMSKPAVPQIKPITPTTPSAAAPVKPIGVPAIKPVPPVAAKPPIAPPKPGAIPAAAAPLGAASTKPIDAKPSAMQSAKPAEGDKGNIFTSLFGKKEAAPTETKEGNQKPKSIIDTIVDKSGKKEIKKPEVKKEAGTGEGFLKFATVLLEFSFAFILISAGFFYAQNIDEKNRALSLLDQENYAIQLHNAALEIEDKEDEKEDLQKEIERYEEGYNDSHIETINKIVDNRMDWPDLLKKLNEVTESVYEKNALLQYVQFNNYNYDAKNGKLGVSATLTDPQGKNLTKLAELEEAFKYYPKDREDPADETKPYFYDMQDFRSFAKSFNKTTGRYESTFSLSLSTIEPEDEKTAKKKK